MINFLPEKIKKEVKKEYFIRSLTVFLSSFFVVSIFIIVFLMPSFILAITRKESITQQLNMIKGSAISQNTETLNRVKIVNEVVKVLSLNTDSPKLVSDLIKSVIQIKNSNIKISAISTEGDSNKFTKIVLRGFSNTREGLTKYTKDLKTLDIFSEVNLPVSSLVKSSDIDFVISLTLKNE